jgi:ketosteroid isomerase-like protein
MKKLILLFAAIMVTVPVAALGEQVADPAETVAAFHQALASGDKDQVLGLLSAELVIFEDSGKEASRKEYASHHLGSDMKFSAGAKRKILDQSVNVGEETSWVMTRYSVKGQVGSKRIKLESAETIVLEKTDEGWRIAHIHWSNKVL